MSRSFAARAAVLALVAASSLALGGCSILGLLSGGGGGDPAQLYRFGADPDATSATRTPTSAPAVRLASVTFDRAADTDRLLGVTGLETAYIANSRWVSPARDLFVRAADRAFDRAGLRLVRREQAIENEAGLVLEVPTFEARYENGADAPPVVIVEVRGAMVRGRGRELMGETAHIARVPATENRVSAIVAAYDAATREAVDHLAQWAGQTVRSAPQAGAPPQG